jgi:hypothetical protein
VAVCAPVRWPCVTYSIISHQNITFLFTPFQFTPTFTGTQLGRKTRACCKCLQKPTTECYLKPAESNQHLLHHAEWYIY